MDTPTGRASEKLPYQDEATRKATPDIGAVPRKKAIEFTGKLSEAEFSEFRRMNRSKIYWLKIFVVCIVALFYIWKSFLMVLHSQAPTLWGVFVLAWGALGCLNVWALHDKKRAWAKQLAELNAKNERIDFTEDGLKSAALGGASSCVPWRSFKGWREGQEIILLDTDTGGTVVVPVTKMSEIERQSIRQFLQSHIHSTPAESSSIRVGTLPRIGYPTGVACEDLPDQNNGSLNADPGIGALPRRTAIEFTSKLTEVEYREFEKMTRSMMYWLDHLLASVLWLSMALGMIVMDLHSPTHRWELGAFLLVVVVGGFLAFLYTVNQEWRRKLARKNACMDRFILTDGGVEWRGASGDSGLVPWSRFYGWREGRQVVVLENSTVKYLILPVTNLSEIERQPIRQFLESHVPRITSVKQ